MVKKAKKEYQLKPLKNDIRFIRLVGGEQISCSFNQCLSKFAPSSHDITRTPEWNGYQPIVSQTYFWECKECGKKINGKGDRSKSFRSYDSAARKGPASPTDKPGDDMDKIGEEGLYI